MSSLMAFLVTFCLCLFVTRTNCFNLSSVDNDELWHLLLNRQISQNNSNDEFISPLLPPTNYDNSRDNGNIVYASVVHDKVNESRDDDGDGVKVVGYSDDDSKTVDKNLKSRFMDIFNVSVDLNGTETADNIQQNVSEATGMFIDDDTMSESDENVKLKREGLSHTTPSVIAIDVFKPSETESIGDDESIEVMFASKVRTKPKPGQTSLVIVFDGTGSMENCLIQLRAGAKQIIDKFSHREDNPIYNYIFVPFRDPRKLK